jgi:hypothetical protein
LAPLPVLQSPRWEVVMKKVALLGILLGSVLLAIGIVQCGGDSTTTTTNTPVNAADGGVKQPSLPGGW